jgi:hypothetical protein
MSMTETNKTMVINNPKLRCRIIQEVDKDGKPNIKAEILPGCVNFSYWVYAVVDTDRWRRKGEGIWLVCDSVTEKEAEHIRKTAIAQWGKDAAEVIGAADVEKETPMIIPEVAIYTVKTIEASEVKAGQLSLF